jgi:large subunit ribosomal protein L35
MTIKKKRHSGAKKRFKLLKSGLVKYTKSKRRHLLTKKSRKLKRSLKESAYILKRDIRHIKPLLAV